MPPMYDPYLQSEYDNSAKVAGSDALLANLPRLAADFRVRHRFADYGVPYGPSARQRLDLFWPDASRAAPMAIFVHGGYWQHSDRAAWSHLAAGLLAHGMAVAMPSYDQCPAVAMPVVVDHLLAVAPALFRLHGRKMLAIGHSAGGHLAAMLLANDWSAQGLPADLIYAALPISGLFDLQPLVRTSVNDALGMDAAVARGVSPMFLPAPGRPLHAVVGGDEGVEYARQSRELAAAWGGAWEVSPGHHHFNVVSELADPTSRVVAIARELADHNPD
jgi:arylformamidase